MIGSFCVSVMSAFGLAVLLVEKRFEWPVRPINVQLRLAIHKIFPLRKRRHLKKLFQCAICTSFWAALLCDCGVAYATGWHYWLWPLSGFAAAGLMWFVLTLFEVLEKRAETGKEFTAIVSKTEIETAEPAKPRDV